MLIYFCAAFKIAKMLSTTDLYLGTFLILCGFALSLFNLKRVVQRGMEFSSVLLSENILLMCIGIAFVSRSLYSLNPTNVNMFDMEEKAGDLARFVSKDTYCGFPTLLLSYGPLVISMVNSFLTLIIDNYMHYKILRSFREKRDENIVREISEDNDSEKNFKYGMCIFWKKYFSIIAIGLQWIIPTLTAFAMYPIDIKEISMSEGRGIDRSCMAMLDLTQDECMVTANHSMDLSKYIQSPVNFYETHDIEKPENDTKQIDTILGNVLRIINSFNNDTNLTFATIKSLRQPKTEAHCMKMCYMDNKSLLTYMFIFGFVSYFIPITISTIILTRIHIMEVTKPSMKLHVTRDLLLNILFWTPMMFDTFLSLILCAYSMHGVRTSMFNVIANVYQVVKNFMNTKYFKENIIVPV